MPVKPRTSLDDMMAELLRPSQPPASAQIQPPPAFKPLTFRPDACGPRCRIASLTLLSELPPIWPHTVPLVEPLIILIIRDLGRRRPSCAGRLPRLSVLARSQLTPLHPHDVGCRPHLDDLDLTTSCLRYPLPHHLAADPPRTSSWLSLKSWK